MTHPERRKKWEYAYGESLGRLCGNGEPTDRQKQQARIEADEHVQRCVDEAEMERRKAKTSGGKK